MVKQDGLLVSVTYRCNADCPYCYIGSFRKKFPEEMGFFTFLNVVNHFIKAGGKKILIIGGEPTLWKPINNAIRYCRLRGAESQVFTNGLEILKVDPDLAYVNLAYYFSQKDRLTKTLMNYKKRGIKIILRYNMTAEDAESKKNRTNDVAKIIGKLAKELGATVHVTPASPFSFVREVGRNIFEFAKIIESYGAKCVIPDPVPPCVFNENEKEYLKKKCKLYHKCGFGFRPLIHPDGKTVQPCARMFFPRPIGDMDNIGRVGELYVDEVRELENNVGPACRECKYFKNKQCCGGCLVSRFEKRRSHYIEQEKL